MDDKVVIGAVQKVRMVGQTLAVTIPKAINKVRRQQGAPPIEAGDMVLVEMTRDGTISVKVPEWTKS